MPNLRLPGANAPKAPAEPAERRPIARRHDRQPVVAPDARRWWPPGGDAFPGLGRRQYAWMAGAAADVRPRMPLIGALPRPPEAPAEPLGAPVRPWPHAAALGGQGRYRMRPPADAYEHLDQHLHALQQLMQQGHPGHEPVADALLRGEAMPQADQALADLALWHAGYDAQAGRAEPRPHELQVVQALRRQLDVDLLEFLHLHEPEVIAPQLHAAGEAIIPQANTGDVHGLHRDRATRHSIARLLTRAPVYDAAACQPQHIAEILAYLAHRERQSAHFASAQDPTGAVLVAHARAALELRCPDNFLGLLDPTNTLMIDALGIDTIPMATVCAVIWDAINKLEAHSNKDAETAALRLERRDMFVRALASCMASPRDAVCAPGQAQRLAMVLQGFVPEVHIETYREICSVNQFVAYTLEGLNRHTAQPTNDEPERIRRYLDRSYLEGRAVYQGQKLAQLEEQLRDFVRLTFDIDDWAPPKL